MNPEERRTLLKKSVEDPRFHAMLLGNPAVAMARLDIPIGDRERLSILEDADGIRLREDAPEQERTLECVLDIVLGTRPKGNKGSKKRRKASKKPTSNKKKKPAKQKKK